MRKKGVTLTELLIVVAVLGILASISIPMFSKTVRRAKLKEVKATADLVAAAVKYYDAKYVMNNTNYVLDTVAQEHNWDALGLDMPRNADNPLPPAQGHTIAYRIWSVGANPGLEIFTSNNTAWSWVYTYNFVTEIGVINAGNNDAQYLPGDMPGT